MRSLFLVIPACFSITACAQFIAGSGGGSDTPSYLCNKTFADANATGITTFNPGVAQGNQVDQPDNDSNSALNAQWAVTIWDNIGASNATAELIGWYNTNGANYSDSADLWYDVCVVTLNTVTHNTLYRAANDNGDCTTAFDPQCVEDLKTQAAQLALGLVSSPTPNPGSNLTAGSLSHVCYDVGNMLGADFPQTCNKYFNGSVTAVGSDMTSHNDSWLYDGCSLRNEEDDTTFHYATGNTIFTSGYPLDVQEALYYNLTSITIPVLTVFLPIADVERETTIQTANAALSCPRVTQINEGSLQTPPLPEPTPVGGSSLSGGAIAGIVIGIIAAVAIILAALWFFYFRKRRASKKASKESDSPPAYTAEAKMAEAPPQNEQMVLTELSGQEAQVRPELPTQKSGGRVELAGDAEQYKSVGGSPAELPGDVK